MPRNIVDIAVGPLPQNVLLKLEKVVEHAPEGLGPFEVSVAHDNGYAIIHGRSEEQLTIVINWLRREFDLVLDVGTPQVAYREILSTPASVNYTHKKQVGGVGQFARVAITFEPTPSGSGESFENRADDHAVPKRFVAAVEKGVRAVADSGVTLGFPVIDYKATLFDGAFDSRDSSELAFELAARACFRQAGKEADAKLAEPIMKLEIQTPNEYVAPILRDLRTRRLVSADSQKNGGDAIIMAEAPLATLLGFDAVLGAITESRGRFSMRLARYAPVPKGPPNDDGFEPAIGARA